jgi:glycosyltransferase involved in cell wall biosynthesis
MQKPPLVSLAIFTYNQQDFIEEAIQSAFDQNYENLEIIISDDKSTDNTFAKAKAMVQAYQGPHRVRLNRNEINMGRSEHVLKILNSINSKLAVLGAGDDASLPNRVEDVAKAWVDHNEPHLILAKFDLIDGNSRVLPNQQIAFNFTPELCQPTPENLFNLLSFKGTYKVYGAATSLNTDSLKYFGPVRQDVKADDVVYFFRALLLGKFHFIDKLQSHYRIAHKDEQVAAPDPIATFGRKVSTNYANKVHFFKMIHTGLQQCISDLNCYMQKDSSAKARYKKLYAQLKELEKVRYLWINWYLKGTWFKLSGLAYLMGTANKGYILWTLKELILPQKD